MKGWYFQGVPFIVVRSFYKEALMSTETESAVSALAWAHEIAKEAAQVLSIGSDHINGFSTVRRAADFIDGYRRGTLDDIPGSPGGDFPKELFQACFHAKEVTFPGLAMPPIEAALRIYQGLKYSLKERLAPEDERAMLQAKKFFEVLAQQLEREGGK